MSEASRATELPVRLDAMFRGAPLVPVPWPQAGRRKHRRTFDSNLVQATVRNPDKHATLREVDPCTLHASQPAITRAGVGYYLTGQYHRTGRTFADRLKAANRIPLIYRRDDTEMIILSGHHRSAAALLCHMPLLALLIDGGWGPAR